MLEGVALSGRSVFRPSVLTPSSSGRGRGFGDGNGCLTVYSLGSDFSTRSDDIFDITTYHFLGRFGNGIKIPKGDMDA